MTDATLEREIPLGMLAKHDIAFLIQKEQIIQNCVPANLKKAVYEMRLGSFAFRWEGDKRKNIRLGDQQGKEKELILPPNSLTFVTTLEKFNLPDNIIARFNLKVDWVHCGLLLGTGPIVNPAFKKYLLIPIHNFSSQTVQIKYADPLIAVEFTKICISEDQKCISEDQKCISEDQKCKFDVHPIEEDVENLLKDYCDKARLVESSVYKAIRESKDEIKASKIHRRTITFFEILTLLGLLFTGYQLVTTTWSTHTETQQKVLAAHEALLMTSSMLKTENGNLRSKLEKVEEQMRSIMSSLADKSAAGNFQESRNPSNTGVIKETQQENISPNAPLHPEGKAPSTPK